VTDARTVIPESNPDRSHPRPARAAEGVLLSAILQQPVAGANGVHVGLCVDVIARLVGRGEPIITGVVLRDDQSRIGVLAIADIGELSPALRSRWARARDLAPLELAADELLVRDALLDKPIVDIDHGALVTVGDALLATDTSERVTLAAVIPASQRPLTALRLRFGRRRARAQAPPIRWAAVAPLSASPDTPTARMAAARLALLHPARIADLVEAASHADGEQIIRIVSYDGRLEADLFRELDDAHRGEFLTSRSDAEAAWVLAQMDADDATDALLELSTERQRQVLSALPARSAAKIRALMRYHAASAGGIMSPDFLALEEQQTVNDARAAIHRSPAPTEALHAVFVTSPAGVLIGYVDLVSVMRSEADAPLASLIAHAPPAVATYETIAEIAVKMTDYNLTVIAVVDTDHRPVGAITIDDIIDRMLPGRWRAKSDLLHHPA
jgi:CBS domain-containing protein